MYKKIVMISALLGLAFPLWAADKAPDSSADKAQDKTTEGDAKVVSGMSILGNNDAPKSLYIVPWKASEIGVETKFTSSLLNEDMVPVDKPVFKRELDFYKISHP